MKTYALITGVFVVAVLQARALPKQTQVKPTTSPSSDGAPVLQKGFVGSPEFKTAEGAFGAGTAFVVKLEGSPKPVLITAQHIFGAAGGLKREIPSQELRGFVKKVSLADFLGNRPVDGGDCRYLPVTGGEGDQKTPDVVAFRLSAVGKFNPAVLATKNPEVDEPIWLVASVQGEEGKTLLHRGVVAEVHGAWLRCKFDNGNLVLRGASGGPYLNAKGEVVGLHSGSFKDPGNVAGSVFSAEGILKALNIQKDPKKDAAAQPLSAEWSK